MDGFNLIFLENNKREYLIKVENIIIKSNN